MTIHTLLFFGQLTYFRASMGDSIKHRKDRDIIVTAAGTYSDECIDGCKRGETNTKHLEMIIPPTPPTDMDTSQIIQIEYKLRVSSVDLIAIFNKKYSHLKQFWFNLGLWHCWMLPFGP